MLAPIDNTDRIPKISWYVYVGTDEERKRGDPNGESYSGHEKPNFLWFLGEIAFSGVLDIRSTTRGEWRGESEASVHSLAVLRPVDWVQREHIYTSNWVSQGFDAADETMTHLFPLPHVHSSQHKWSDTYIIRSWVKGTRLDPRPMRHELRTIVCIQRTES